MRINTITFAHHLAAKRTIEEASDRDLKLCHVECLLRFAGAEVFAHCPTDLADDVAALLLRREMSRRYLH